MRGSEATAMLVRALAAVAVVAACPASADVLEIAADGPKWIAGGPIAPPPGLDVAHPAHHSIVNPAAGPAAWRARLVQLATKYDISPALLDAVISQESGWNPNAVSSAGARGLAQLMPDTARYLGVDSHDPDSNLEGGARYLRMMLDSFGGDLEKALAAYNAGPSRVRRAGGVPAIRETRDYVASIMARLSQPVRR